MSKKDFLEEKYCEINKLKSLLQVYPKEYCNTIIKVMDNVFDEISDYLKEKQKEYKNSETINSITEYLFEDKENTFNIMENLEEDVLVCAHTHIPSFKKFNNKYFINVGSVGKPKIGRPIPTYCIIDIDDNSNIDVNFRYVEYEYKRIVKDCTMLRFPSQLIESYVTGRE